MDAGRPSVLRKHPGAPRTPPNLADPRTLGAPLDWDRVRSEFEGIPGGGFNLAWEAVERHARGERAEKTALRFIGREGERQALSFGELARSVRRCASALRSLGVHRGDRVFLLLERTPELYAAFFGALECGAVVCTLPAGTEPEPLRARLALGRAKILVTSAALCTPRVRSMACSLPDLGYVIAVEDASGEAPSGTLGFAGLLAHAAKSFAPERTGEEDPALLCFTRGTTGAPKATLHVHGAALMHHVAARYALDLHPEDVFWSMPDPDWVTGTVYGMVAGLLLGVTNVIDSGTPDAERAYRVLEEERVTVWCTTPGVLGELGRAGPAPARARDLASLRFVASVGAPLDPEVVWWGQEVLGRPIHDHWGQAEIGGTLIANVPVLDIKPGALGRPLPGVDACIVRRGPDGAPRVLTEPDAEGELALRAGWPSMFRAYLGQEERYRERFAGGLYLTGDRARRDADGYFWLVGRADGGGAALGGAGRPTLAGPI